MIRSAALSKAFEKAFIHSSNRDVLSEILSFLGEEIICDRIAIFEYVSDGTLSNSFEWCRAGIPSEREFLLHIPSDRFDYLDAQIDEGEIIFIDNIEDIRSADNGVYEFLINQRIHSFVASRLAFHDDNIGFFVIENPQLSSEDDLELVIPGIRYILSSLVYSYNIDSRLTLSGQTDTVTGLGNRAGLQEHMKGLNSAESIGVIYLTALGWDIADGHMDHISREQINVHTGNVLKNIFEANHIFRIDEKEYIVILDSIEQEAFMNRKLLLANMLRENNLLVALGSVWAPELGNDHDSIIRRAHIDSQNEIRAIGSEEHTAHNIFTVKHDLKEQDRAKINMLRGEDFFRRADDYLSEFYEESLLTAVIDVNYFKLYNDIFGRKAGNIFLESLAETVQSTADKNDGIAGYLGGDNFCIIVPVGDISRENLKRVIEGIMSEFEYTDGFSPVSGIYISKDRQETTITMYDRALVALSEIKGSYFEMYRFYDAEHFMHIRDDKIMLMDIRKGLKDDEFTFYIQPQVNGTNSKIIGCEALIRWKKNGRLISPGQFIPILEKTGYIYEVDSYIWERVVKWIRGLIDRGIKPVPCSVNISRVDFFFTDIAEHFIELLDRYSLPHNLIGIEITESAFTDNADVIYDAVSRLQREGFRILMDDFGSGSSSLSMLHTMNLDVLKTDVNFMSSDKSDNKAISIVESVISMAHMIGMLVITEGVETEDQKNNLIAIGDNFIQGYYFYKPMPQEDFERLLENPAMVGDTPERTDAMLSNHIHFRDIVKQGMISETLLDNIIGPAAIIKEEGDDFVLLQMNENFHQIFGDGLNEGADMAAVYNSRCMPVTGVALKTLVDKASRHPLDGIKWNQSLDIDGNPLELEIHIFLLYSFDTHKMYLLTADS